MNTVTSHVRVGTMINSFMGLIILALISVAPTQAQSLALPADAVVIEGNSLTVKVTYTGAATTAVGTVDYQILGGAACSAMQNSATPGDDFVVASGSLSFPIGSSTGTFKTFTVQTVEDSIRENADQPVTNSECFRTTLSNHTAAVFTVGITDAEQIIDITDDEADPTLTILDGSANENAGVAPLEIFLSGPIDEDLDFNTNAGGTEIDISFIDVSTEAADADYNDGNTVATEYNTILSAGTTSTVLNVALTDDLIFEGTEEFNVQIAGDARYDLADGIGKVTIFDNEGLPELSIDDDSEIEGTALDFAISLSHAAEAAYNASINYQDVTATAVLDYTPVYSVMIPAGSTGPVMLTVSTVPDTEVEDLETFIVSIVDGADYNVDNGNALGAIVDNDSFDLVMAADGSNPASVDLITAPTTADYKFTVTNTGLADATMTATVTFTASGYDLTTPGLALVPGGACAGYAGSATTTTCTIVAGFLEDGESVMMTLTGGTVTAAAGETLSVTASVTTADAETSVANNAATSSTQAIGADYGDIAAHGAGYHLMSTNLRLGDTVAAEVSNPGGDGALDDDGVFVPATMYNGSHPSFIAVDVQGGAGFVTVTGSHHTSAVDVPVVEGLNWIPVTYAGAAAGPTSLRVRLCAAAGDCDGPTEAADTGEMEDHSYTVAAPTATQTFMIPSGTMEPVTLRVDGADYEISDGNGVVIFESPVATLTGGIDIVGNDDPNTLVIDVQGIAGDFQISFDGGDGSDAIEFHDSIPATSVATVTHVAADATSGTVSGDADWDVTYTDVEPILDNMLPMHRVMTFSGADDDIILRDNGSSIDGLSFIDSGFAEAYTFANPSATLTINAGGGDDTIDFQGVDESGGAAFAITFNGGTGQDVITVLPFDAGAAVSISSVNGGPPATCQGDVLDIDNSTGAVVDATSLVPGAGSVLFTSTHTAVSYTGIESFADHVADVMLTMTMPSTTATNPGDNLTITLKVTNNGPDTASCVVVGDIFMNGALIPDLGTVNFTQGSFNNPEWEVGPLASGAMATITYDVVVGAVFNGTATITALSPESDPDLTNNTVSLQIDPAFFFPVKAQATAAVWFDQGLGENLIVGTANGFAGLNSSVLCRVDTFGGIFPENLWRECGDGLPYPLYVNDMFVDTQGTPGNDDDIIWLASWGSDGLYFSTDGGETFQAAQPDLGPGTQGWVNVYAITQDRDEFLYISTNHGFLFRSLNNGATWQQIGSLPEVDADTPWSLTTHPTESGRLYAGTFGRGVYTSDDYGFTWEFLGGQAVNQLLISDRGGHAFDLELDPTGRFLFAATGGGVFRLELDGSGNGAGLWTMLETDVILNDGSVVTPEARSLSFDMSGQLYVTTWGFGAFFSAGPTVSNVMMQIALRGEQVGFVSVSPDGTQVAFGSVTTGVTVIDAPAASATDVEDETVDVDLPNGFALEQNYPNPFNPVTTISFSLNQASQARLAVYDVLGREVAVLVDGKVQAGQHSVQFDAQGLTTGTYIYRLETDKGAFSRQLVLMK